MTEMTPNDKKLFDLVVHRYLNRNRHIYKYSGQRKERWNKWNDLHRTKAYLEKKYNIRIG